jgi:hypothetical protein
MHSARVALDAGLSHIKEQVQSIEEAVVENPALAFDLARTLVESVCRTILTERQVSYSETDDLPKLFRIVCHHLPFLPPTASNDTAARESLRRAVSGLSTTVQGICELRNQCGFASHGSGGPRAAMGTVQALLAAQAADAIVGFLYGVHRHDPVPPPSPRAEYDENEEFNEYVDEVHGPILIFDIEFRPSEILYQMEPESYRIYAAEFDKEADPDPDDPDEQRGPGR